jgi:hypothetical protein
MGRSSYQNAVLLGYSLTPNFPVAYKCSIRCGLPSVTLLGKRSDWEDILDRTERLKTFGQEATIWYGLLQPVLKRFVQSFDKPDSHDIRDFWQKIAHYSGGGSGPTYLSGRCFKLHKRQQLTCSGWITAFCFWDAEGTASIN